MPADATPTSEEMAALSTLWEARGLSPVEFEERSDGTLEASDRQLTLARGDVPHDPSAALVAEPLSVGDELGRGGMGVVSSAEQLALRREVAVKRVREGAGASAAGRLLKEAWIGAYLAHPNVVPVHALAAHDGAPAVVMKRVDGEPWRASMQDEGRLDPEHRADPLGWHIEVLLSVCNAIELAHSRGVLHLDLKPDNVMIGSFGEIYVVDWGLAAGLEGAPTWLPPASSIRSVSGTPDYMAPELAAGASDRIDERTDVYLLGAMLHEALTGTPPHSGQTPIQKLYRAHLSRPHDYEESVPSDLVALLHRAMAKDREARFGSVRELREALLEVRDHRAAEALVETARAQVAELEALLDRDSITEVEVWQRFGACRFAFREADKAWSEHPALGPMRPRLYTRMARWAVDVGRLELAESYLEELEGARPPEIVEALDALRTQRAHEAARVGALEELAYQSDITQGARFRRRIALSLGALFLVVNLAMGAAERAGLVSLGYGAMLITGLSTFAFFTPYSLWKRRAIFRNRANSTLFSILITIGVVVQGLWLLGFAADLPFRVALGLTPIFYLLAFGAMTMLVSPRFFLSPLLQVPTALAAAAFPEHVYEILGVGCGLSAALIGAAYQPTDEREQRARA